ncbi:PREDICTED: uncharacterized protein LOC105361698 [Ceratosolen solmsi marchali]|uniref:Uncharacterized protein LOC105361698 n=1 Tax=Ceratosolen solmsi marchali TaxID=326594 RepID=A0AAJ7DUV1_9HYME|nr:PREDICTED: uncharacterized protein LOC105361698 [Ceratosolen solmsi marchali]
MNTLMYDDQDPDYFMLFNSDISHQNIFEKNVRSNTAKKISSIIEPEFINEINNKKTEIYKIYKNLSKACKMLHYLRFSIITNFYNRESIYNSDIQAIKQSRLHCTLTSFTKNASTSNIKYTNNCLNESNEIMRIKRKNNNEYNNFKRKCLKNLNPEDVLNRPSLPISTLKLKKRIIVGNISKWIIPDLRDSNSTHKWTIYIRDSNKCDVGQFISKVRFFLHPSYKPNDIVELTSTPFHLSRYGWGEFPVRIQLHFTNSFNRPVDIIHHLKLDRTFTGLQTIGSETIVDLWINVKDISSISSNIKKTNNKNNISINDKFKIDLSANRYFNNDHNYIGTSVRNDEENSNLQNSQTFTDLKLKILQTNSDSEQLSLIQLNILEDDVIKHCSTNNKYKSQEVTNIKNSLKHSYFDTKIYSKLNTSYSILKFIMKRIPLISKKSSKSYYKLLHYYRNENYHQFCNYSKGKQQSLERYRAIYALTIIQNIKYFKYTYNINELITWTKRYCYSPILNLKNIHKICISSKSDNIKTNSLYEYTSTISDQLYKWFLQCQITSPNLTNFASDNNDQIDILNIPLKIPDALAVYYDNLYENHNTVFLIKYPETDDILSEYVCKSVQKIGLKFVNEEILPGISHHSAILLMTKAIEFLVDDLIRIAFSCALDKLKNERSSIFIKLDDVRMALLKKEEFEIFTNAGLGSEG